MPHRIALPLALVASLALLPPAFGSGARPEAAAAPREGLWGAEPTLVCIQTVTEVPPRVYVLAECGAAKVTVEARPDHVGVGVELECQVLGKPCPPVRVFLSA